MILGNRIDVSKRAGANGWDYVEVKSGKKRVRCSYQIKQQITIKLDLPYGDTITIETNEPINDKSDIEQFAKEMLYAADLRHETNRKQTISNNAEAFRSNILPLWFEREARKARYNANIQDMRKTARRKLNAGEIPLKEYNDLIRSLNCYDPDDDDTDLTEYNRKLQQALTKLRVSKDFHFSYREIERLIGKNTWEDSLQTREYSSQELDIKLHNVLTRNLNSFNQLYNLEPQRLSLSDVRTNYDSVTVTGFNDVVLAATFHKEGNICAVMAIDNNQGRKALCHLVGRERLAEILPKRIFNAVTREEHIVLQDVEYLDLDTYKTIIIE
jgi:hypothetical protein